MVRSRAYGYNMTPSRNIDKLQHDTTHYKPYVSKRKSIARSSFATELSTTDAVAPVESLQTQVLCTIPICTRHAGRACSPSQPKTDHHRYTSPWRYEFKPHGSGYHCHRRRGRPIARISIRSNTHTHNRNTYHDGAAIELTASGTELNLQPG